MAAETMLVVLMMRITNAVMVHPEAASLLIYYVRGELRQAEPEF
jgi:hypothetical protein